MPWLRKTDPAPTTPVKATPSSCAEDVFLVHVPRCGGTSLTRAWNVAKRACAGKNLAHAFCLAYFRYRYWLYEHQAMPLVSVENFFSLLMISVGVVLWFETDTPAPFVIWSVASVLIFFTTYVFTPYGCRVNAFSRFIQLVGDLTFSESHVVYGANKHGFLMHLTSEELVRHGYVSERDMREKSVAVVRDPFSRLVSVWKYNRLPFESFDHFVRELRAKGKDLWLRGDRSTDQAEVYCHFLPQRAFTHRVVSTVEINAAGGAKVIGDKAERLVRTIIKLESVSSLFSPGKGTEGTAGEKKGSPWLTPIPTPVLDCFRDVPRRNARRSVEHWSLLYTRESFDAVCELYAEDFAAFGYALSIDRRPDLVASGAAADKVTALRAGMEEGGGVVGGNNGIGNVDGNRDSGNIDGGAREEGRGGMQSPTRLLQPASAVSEIAPSRRWSGSPTSSSTMSPSQSSPITSPSSSSSSSSGES